jgi:hypothetical protein
VFQPTCKPRFCASCEPRVTTGGRQINTKSPPINCCASRSSARRTRSAKKPTAVTAATATPKPETAVAIRRNAVPYPTFARQAPHQRNRPASAELGGRTAAHANSLATWWQPKSRGGMPPALRSFNPFGDHFKTQALSQRHDAANNRFVSLALTPMPKRRIDQSSAAGPAASSNN